MRPPVGPFRQPTAGRLLVKAIRDDAFGAEMLFVVEGLPSTAGVRLSGAVRGPDCSRATTLPVTIPLLPVASPRGVAARAVLTEPAAWTPELPNRYRLEARLEGFGSLGEEPRQPFGGWIALRRLGRRGRSFRLDGRRFVLRGGPAVAIGEAAASVAATRERNHAVVVGADDPEFVTGVGGVTTVPAGGETLEAFLDTADREGAFVVVGFDADGAESVATGTAFHPSAAFVIARDRGAADVFGPLRTPSGPLLGLAVDGGSLPPADVARVDFLVVLLAEESLPHHGWLADPPPLPLVACRPSRGEQDACGLLQAELSRWAVERCGPILAWDWAGYLVARW